MLSEGIYPIGDGLLDIEDDRLKGLLFQDDINEIYDVEQTPFARGKFAAVRRAIHKNSGVHFAAKFLKRRRRAQSSDKEIKHEIAVLMLCSGSENIVKLNAVHESRSDTALLLELATGGELQTFLDNEECLSEAQARVCMREVLKALKFLHNRSIAHLDLKPQNILLTGERIEDGLKLCDFGISRVVIDGSNVREIVGTPDYVAPEVLQYEPLSLQTDIWSVGVLTYVLLSGFSPFGGDTKQETFLNISQCALTFPDKLFNGISSQAIDFIRRALRIKPNDRMTALGCLEHVWLKDECSIDRQIFNKNSKAMAMTVAGEEEENRKIILGDDDENDEFNEEKVHGENCNKQNGFNQDRMNGVGNGSGGDGGKIHCNGSVRSHISSSNNSKKTSNGNCGTQKSKMTTIDGGRYQPIRVTSKPSAAVVNGVSSCSSSSSNIAMISASATRATTSPITMQNSHSGSNGSLLVAPRRHSSDSNKENHNFLTKKYQTIPSIGTTFSASITKKPIITATVNGNGGRCNSTRGSNSGLPNGTTTTNLSSNSTVSDVSTATVGAVSNSHGICLFPDAPTTPKVIRKAPTSDTSPTSVKALVKKFQLENKEMITINGGNPSQTPSSSPSSLLLKEAQHNNHQRNQQQHNSRRSSTGIKNSITSDKIQNSSNSNSKKHSHQQYKSNSNNISNNNLISCNRRSSSNSNSNSSNHCKNSILNNKTPSSSQEDITNASGGNNCHQKLTTSHSHPISMTSCSSSLCSSSTSNSVSNISSPASTLALTSTITHSKSKCLFCMTCNGPDCPHSIVSGRGGIINNSTITTTTSSSSSSVSASAASSTAILINQKSSANSISLDKGIIY